MALVKSSECNTSASMLNNCDQSTDTRRKALREEILYFLNRTRWRVIKAEATEQLTKTHKQKKHSTTFLQVSFRKSKMFSIKKAQMLVLCLTF